MNVSTPVKTSVPAKVPRVAVYLPDELYKLLEGEASQEERSLSQMALILIREALTSRYQARTEQSSDDEQQTRG